MAARKRAPGALREEAARRALDRLLELLEDPELSRGELLKTIQLALDRCGEGGETFTGDFTIDVPKE